MTVLTDYQKKRFTKEGILALGHDDLALQNTIPDLQNVAATLKPTCDSSWDARGWTTVRTQDELVRQMLSGSTGQLIHELTNDYWSNHIQFTWTTPTDYADDLLNQHRDGAESPHQKHIDAYRVQLAVLLSDVTEQDGPFVYWPGSHLLAAEYAAANPTLSGVELTRAQIPNLGTPVSFLGHAGDALLCHPLLTHGTEINRGKLRTMAFVRVGSYEDKTRLIYDHPFDNLPGIEYGPLGSK